MVGNLGKISQLKYLNSKFFSPLHTVLLVLLVFSIVSAGNAISWYYSSRSNDSQLHLVLPEWDNVQYLSYMLVYLSSFLLYLKKHYPIKCPIFCCTCAVKPPIPKTRLSQIGFLFRELNRTWIHKNAYLIILLWKCLHCVHFCNEDPTHILAPHKMMIRM